MEFTPRNHLCSLWDASGRCRSLECRFFLVCALSTRIETEVARLDSKVGVLKKSSASQKSKNAELSKKLDKVMGKMEENEAAVGRKDFNANEHLRSSREREEEESLGIRSKRPLDQNGLNQNGLYRNGPLPKRPLPQTASNQNGPLPKRPLPKTASNWNDL